MPNEPKEIEDKVQKIHPCLRGLLMALGITLVASSMAILYLQPDAYMREIDNHGTAIKIIRQSVDVTTPFVATLLSGAIIVLFSANGLRFSRIAARGVEVESPVANEPVKKYYGAAPDERPKTEVVVQDAESPEPTEIPAEHVSADDGKYAVYKLCDVPAGVIADALTNWPLDSNRPEDLSGFEFSTRKIGKGNHPWTLKFKGKKAVVVSYGGRGKAGATVSGEPQ